MAIGKISCLQLIAILFFAVSGGPYGFEDVIGASGGAVALLCLLIAPFLWSAPLALVTGELACMIPESGGHIIWVHRAFGPFYSFLNSTFTFAYSVLDGALYPALFLDYVCTMVYGDDASSVSMVVSVCVKVALVATAALLNFRGVDLVGHASLIFGVLVLLPFLGLSIVSFSEWNVDWMSFPGPQNTNWALMLSVLLWNISGYDAVGACAHEVDNPEWTYPVALGSSIILTMVTYAVPSLVGLSIAPYYTLWQNGSFVMVALHVGGRVLEVWLALGGAASAFGLLLTRLCINSRLIQGMAAIHKAPVVFQQVDSKSGTPWSALAILSLCIVVLSTLRFRFIVEAAMVLYACSNMLKFASLIQLRMIEPDAYRPFCIPLSTPWLCCMLVPPFSLGVIVIVTASPTSHLVVAAWCIIAVTLFILVQLLTFVGPLFSAAMQWAMDEVTCLKHRFFLPLKQEDSGNARSVETCQGLEEQPECDEKSTFDEHAIHAGEIIDAHVSLLSCKVQSDNHV